jgi:PAS domain S-box-containing protein
MQLMPFRFQSVQSQSKASITKLMSILGAFAACVFAIAIPSVYYAISINGAEHTLTTEAVFLAKSVEKIIQARPDLWEYESVRLKEFISQASIPGEEHEREIRTAAGKLVVKTDFTETRPIISASATFFDSGRRAGSITVRHSIHTQIITTTLLGILSSLLGCLIYFIFRTYPIRKLENTLTDLQRERDKSDKTLYAIGDGVITADHKGKILFINRVAESLVGMDTSEAVGRQLEEVYVLRQGQRDQVGEKGCILAGKGGNEYAIEEVRTPLTEMESDKTGVVIVFRDITERKQAEDKIKTLLSEKELLLREVHHRIKNHMSVITGLLFLQSGALKDPAAIAALKDSRSRVQSMMVLYDKLYRSADFRQIPVKGYFTSLIDEIAANFPNRQLVTIEKQIDDFILGAETLSPVGMILNELLTNAMKHAFIGREKGVIGISLSIKETHVTLIIQDNGVGVPGSIDIGAPTGFGMQLIGMLTAQLNGTIRFERQNGATFIIEFDV